MKMAKHAVAALMQAEEYAHVAEELDDAIERGEVALDVASNDERWDDYDDILYGIHDDIYDRSCYRNLAADLTEQFDRSVRARPRRQRC